MNSQHSLDLRSIGEAFMIGMGLAHAALAIPEARWLVEMIAEEERQRALQIKSEQIGQVKATNERQFSEMADNIERSVSQILASSARVKVGLHSVDNRRVWPPGTHASRRRRRRF